MNQTKFQKISFVIFFSYTLLSFILFFLMGEQLHLRNSRSNYTSLLPESATVELAEHHLIEQYFYTEIQRLEEISIQWGTYYRENFGIAAIELWDLEGNILLFSDAIDMSLLSEGEVSTITIQEPFEGLFQVPLVLRIYSENGQYGSSATPMMSLSRATEESIGDLYLDGQVQPGTLCFTLSGEDYIWTGLHYWTFVFLGAVVLFSLLTYSLWLVQQGKNCYFYNGLCAMEKYRFLIEQLVARDFRGKYKRSVLGVFWSFLNPLLTMTVQYVVFSELFRFDLPHYPVYLLCGIILFGFFTESCSMTLMSIVGNANLITKVYVPKYVYPLTRTVSSLVNLLISLIPLFVVALFSGLIPSKSYLLLPFVLICLAVFSFGIGLILCTSMVFFRDTQFLWGIFNMIWMYLTPIFYPAEILPDNVAWVLNINPLYYFITFARTLILEGISPEPIVYVQCLLTSLFTLLIGLVVFKKNQDKFVLYI